MHPQEAKEKLVLEVAPLIDRALVASAASEDSPRAYDRNWGLLGCDCSTKGCSTQKRRHSP